MRHAIEGNLCRCTGYHNIVKSIQLPRPDARRCHRSGGRAGRPGLGEGRTDGSGRLGTPLKRKEDPRFITGTATLTMSSDHPAHAAILRSPYAHARIRGIETGAAAAMPGVLAVVTGADFADLPALPCAWPAGGASSGGGLYTNNLTPRLLAIEDVKWAGEGVAMVIAETTEQAQDAIDAIEVDWGRCPRSWTPGVVQPGAPRAA